MPSLRRASKRSLWLPIIVGLCVALPACRGSRKIHKHPVFVTESDAAKYLNQAIEADSADQRREAIVRLSKTRYADRDVIVRGMILIARTDTSSCVRSAAIRALEESAGPRLVEPMLEILASPAQRDPQVVTPNDSVRWDAIGAITTVVESGADVSEHRDAIVATAIRLLGTDPSRDARATASALLGYFPERNVLDALAQGLMQRDFGVVYACERSLMRLTGHTHDHDPAAWQAWLRETKDPFADAGKLDHQLEPDNKNWLHRTWDATTKAFASYRPKED